MEMVEDVGVEPLHQLPKLGCKTVTLRPLYAGAFKRPLSKEKEEKN